MTDVAFILSLLLHPAFPVQHAFMTLWRGRVCVGACEQAQQWVATVHLPRGSTCSGELVNKTWQFPWTTLLSVPLQFWITDL